jgi:hypothetical protein
MVIVNWVGVGGWTCPDVSGNDRSWPEGWSFISVDDNAGRLHLGPVINTYPHRTATQVTELRLAPKQKGIATIYSLRSSWPQHRL